jgi:hypothetical protein
MIRSLPNDGKTRFTFDQRGSGTRRVGDVISTSLSFNPITAGISAATSLASSAVMGWMNSIQLSHDADTATTQIANGLSAQLQNLLNAYMSEQNVSCADQRAALNAFDQAIVWFISPQGCGNGQYGSAGNRCVSERAYPGAKYSYYTYFRDPIANDPRLAGAGCDTGQEVILPNASGGYADTGITSTGGSGTTGATAAQIAAAATTAAAATGLPANTTPATAAATIAGIPSTYVYVGLGLLGAALLAREL